MDHGRTTFMRYLYTHDTFDQETVDRQEEIFQDLNEWANSKEFKKQIPNIVPMTPYAHRPTGGTSRKEERTKPKSYSFMDLHKKIQDILDPNKIMDPLQRRLQE